MEAANRGAQEAGGRSVGCNITLAHEQFPNRYLDRYVTCHYFFVRKVLLFKYSYAFVVLPGGLGTLDELTEALTLIQTGKILQFPVVLMGVTYWKPFTDLLKEMVAHGTMSATDLDLFLVDRQRPRCDGAHRAPRDPPVRPHAAQGAAAAPLAVGRGAEERSDVRLEAEAEASAPTCDLIRPSTPDRTGHARAAVAAVAVRVLGQVLLVVRLGVIERRRRRNLGRDRAVARRRRAAPDTRARDASAASRCSSSK